MNTLVSILGFGLIPRILFFFLVIVLKVSVFQFSLLVAAT